MHCCDFSLLPFNLRHVYSLLHHFSELGKNKWSLFFSPNFSAYCCCVLLHVSFRWNQPSFSTDQLHQIEVEECSLFLWDVISPIKCVLFRAYVRDRSIWKCVWFSWAEGKRLTWVTHLGNFVCGDSRARVPRLFSPRSHHGSERAFAELMINNTKSLNS